MNDLHVIAYYIVDSLMKSMEKRVKIVIFEQIIKKGHRSDLFAIFGYKV
jgi:hypothetical protein